MSKLDSFITKLSMSDIRCITLHIKWYGAKGAIKYAQDIMEGCQTVYPNGIHRCQTDSAHYAFCIQEIFYILEEYSSEFTPEEKQNIIKETEELHDKNLLFEIDHPKIEYKNKTKIKKTSSRGKQTKLFSDAETRSKPARREKSQPINIKEVETKLSYKLSL